MLPKIGNELISTTPGVDFRESGLGALNTPLPEDRSPTLDAVILGETNRPGTPDYSRKRGLKGRPLQGGLRGEPASPPLPCEDYYRR